MADKTKKKKKNKLAGGQEQGDKQVTKLLNPLDEEWEINSPFGDPRSTGPHRGTDIACVYGTVVRAPAAGTLELASANGYASSAFGERAVVLKTSDYTILFGHLSKNVLNGESSREVDANDVIGETGGREASEGQSTGPHLHLGVFSDGEPVDPAEVFSQGTKRSSNGETGKDIKQGGDLEKDDGSNVLADGLIIAGSVLAVGIVVGLLTESIQGACYRASQNENKMLSFLNPLLYKLSLIPGLAHIDWHHAIITDETINRKQMFRKFKEICYARSKVYVGHYNQEGAKQIDDVKVLSDVDFDHTLELELITGERIYAVKLGGQVRNDGLYETDIAYVAEGYDQTGSRRWIALPGFINLVVK